MKSGVYFYAVLQCAQSLATVALDSNARRLNNHKAVGALVFLRYNALMKDFDWRKRYAPHGYAYVKRRLDFATLDFARFPSGVLQVTVEEMQRKLGDDCSYFNPATAHTRVSVYPIEVGENLNHLDPLKPRLGLEIEIRQPVPKGLATAST